MDGPITRRNAIGTVLVAVLLHAPAPGLAERGPADALQAAKAPTVLIMPVQATGEVPAALAQNLSAVLVVECGKVPGYQVVSYREVESAMTLEQMRQLSACDSVSCAAEIAGALNSEQTIIGTLGRVGGSYVLALSRISAREAKVVGRVSKQVSASDDALLIREIPGLARELFGLASLPAPAPLETRSSESAPRWRAWALRAGGAVAVAGGTLLVAAAAAGAACAAGIYLAYPNVIGAGRYYRALQGAVWVSAGMAGMAVAPAVLMAVVAGLLFAGSFLVG